MGYELYSGEMYNQEIKEKFLERYDNSTHVTYARIFLHSFPIESKLNKDLYDFNIDEIADLIYSLNPSTKAAARSSISIIRTYIDWAISRRKNNINPLDSVLPDWHQRFIDESDMPFLTKRQIDETIEQTINYQSAVIISLLFEGVGGKEISELRNLKLEHVNQDTNEIILFNDEGQSRTISVSEQCIKLIIGAYNQQEFYKSNGEIDPNAKANSTVELIDCGYIIKAARLNTDTNGPVKPHLIYQRLINLSKIFEIDHLSKVKAIQQSGMIWMAKNLLEKDGVLEKEQYIQICKQFNTAKRVAPDGHVEYIWPRIRDIVPQDLVEKLYP